MYMGNQTLQAWQSDRREPCRAYLSPLLLWSKEKLCSWAVSPCLRNTQQKILCKWEMREVIGNICKTFPYIFIVYYFFLLPLVKS